VREVLGLRRRVDALDVVGGGERLHLADRPAPHGDRRLEIGEQLDDSGARHPLHEIHPV
jgi:hypothetical protein